ncbi:MAG: phosphotransferase [Acidobacteria bacterium]|nr:phosphotransferase [Acidobacteriota bacterium]
MINEGVPHRELAERIERLAGARVESYRRVEGGYTVALRLLCRTGGGGSFFAKVGTTPLTRAALRREIHVYERLRGDFMPRLLASEDDESDPVLLIEDLSEHYWPPPWGGRQIELTLAQLDALHGTKAPFETYAQVHGAGVPNWLVVAEDPAPFLSLGFADANWLGATLPTLIEVEESCPTAGESLTHWDLRSDNICLKDGRAVFVDWNGACLSNPRLDLGFWLPSLAYESGVEPEEILPDAPEVAARVSGYFASRAGLPGIGDAPRVRAVQRRQLETALPWAVRALGLPPLAGKRMV